MGDHTSKPHKLIITCSDIEEGILDYDIIHPDECETVTEPMFSWVDGELVEDWTHTYECYTCAVAYEIDAIGIDDLREQLTNEPYGYPPEGEYEFEAWWSYDSYNHEHDGGLRLINV